MKLDVEVAPGIAFGRSADLQEQLDNLAGKYSANSLYEELVRAAVRRDIELVGQLSLSDLELASTTLRLPVAVADAVDRRIAQLRLVEQGVPDGWAASWTA